MITTQPLVLKTQYYIMYVTVYINNNIIDQLKNV